MKLPTFFGIPKKVKERSQAPVAGALAYLSRVAAAARSYMVGFKTPFMVRKVVGHSMLPVLPPGTLVIGIRNFKKLRPGNVVVIIHEGKEKIKRVDQIEENRVFVLGDHGDDSQDSRHFGWLALESVNAKIIWPRAKRLQE